MSLKKSLLSLLVALVCVAAGEGSSMAQNDPMDNTFPGGPSGWYGSAYVIECNGTGICGGGGGASISPTGDLDHVVVNCGRSIVTQIKVNLLYGAGDLDLCVYKPNQTLIACSAGTGIVETVNTGSENLNSVVAKIYGYMGATGSYVVNVSCAP